MIKLKAVYSTEEEKDELLRELKSGNFQILKVSKEYKKEGPYKRIYIDLSNK